MKDLSNSKRIGLLVTQLGSPHSPDPQAVSDFLKQFLNDPHVIDLPWILRYPLVNAILIPLRKRKSSEGYSKIWTKEGSPLLTHTARLVSKLKKKVSFPVEFGMRYGNPSIENGLEKLVHQAVNHVILLPLFPQYSHSTSESTIFEFQNILKKYKGRISASIIESFYQHDDFISSIAGKIKTGVKTFQPDLVVLSYHGVPVHQLTKTNNKTNYRDQCLETSRLIQQKIGLNDDQLMTAFQSRLGTMEWIKPYTDSLLKELPKQGKKRILIVAPSFTTDCLETLEEIQIRYRDDFLKNGGEEFRYIPCLNSDDHLVNAITEITRPYTTI